MQRKIAFCLTCVFLYMCLAPAALAVTPVYSKKEQQVRAAVAQLGTGKATRVAVKLRDGTRLKGYISSADNQTFSVSDLKTRLERVVRYSDVTQMHAQNLTDGQKILIGAAFVVALLTALLLAAHSSR